MAAVAGAAAIIGAGVQIYGQLSAASSQAEAQRKEAELKNLQANELMQRQAINEQVMRDKVAQAELRTGTASGGITNTGLGQRLQLHKELRQNLAVSQREVEWKTKMLRLGAEADLQLASDVMAAGGISAAGTALTGVARGYEMYRIGKPPSSSTTDLPGVS